MANSVYVLLALVALFMQHDVIQSLPSKNRTMRLTPQALREGLTQRLAKQWKNMGAPIKLSEKRKQKMTIEEYNKLVREVIEDSNGSHVIDIGEFKPAEKLSSDRHYFVGRNGDINKLPNFGHQIQLKKPDKILPRKQMTSHRRKRASEKSKYLSFVSWPNNLVPFITTNMQTGDDFLTWIQEGVDMFREETCLQWAARSDEKEYVDFVGGDQDGFCSAYIGRQYNRPTTVTLDQVTDNCNEDYVVYHEMMHAIGLEHEQSRPDRYSALQINWECIVENTIFNFIKRPLATDVEFDWTSIMQYVPAIFNKCGSSQGTMQTSDPSYNSLLYTLSRKFTHYDSQTIVRAYECDEDCADNCENGGFIRKTVNNDQCHCRCPEYLTGLTCADRTIDTSGFPNPYPVGEACTYLIKAPVNNRIRITLKGLDVPCGHDLEFRTHLMGELGLLECGSLSSEKEFVTFPNGEANIAMVILHADDTSITPGTGASLELTAFASGCVDNPCRNGGTCDEDISTPAFCICPPGYSGDTCNFVTATATVGCDVQSDVEGVCCFTDVSAGAVEFFQIRNPTDVLSPYLLANTIGIYYITDEALLESNVEFEDAVRCLSFDEAAIQAQNSNARLRTTYTEKDGTVKLVSETEDTDGFFVSRQATLSRHVEKISFSATIYLGAAAVTNILISPGLCSNATCASLSFTLCDNGGICDESSGTLLCNCIGDFTGTYCEIPLNESSIKCTFETGTTCPFINPSSESDLWTSQTGPTPQRSTGPSGAYAGNIYLRTDAQKNRLTTSTLQLEADLSARARCLVLNYNMNGRDIASLAVLHDNSTLFEENGNKRNRWFTKMIDVTTTPQSNLTIVGEATNKKGDIAIDDLELLPFECDKLLICTFEIDYKPCTVSRKTKWMRQKGNTRPGTGPQNAHEGDYYVYLQSNSQRSALLTIPHTFSGK
ncbi:uncharacterized protein LOC110451302 [Mizuhopecten yessoensis]|uniref:uncharacterized protein LOC110451302 n=1 Tax=Mizuhopecten yessoensis TaxID=6573 RepID=UPI000B45E604|nr:uncharacterized protein LOC110451302 [Mizuhopecten yessoensis]